MTNRHRKSQAGVTFVEILVTVAIVVILATVATAPFPSVIASMRMRSATSDMLSDLILARSEALKRAQAVRMTPNASGWTNGWTIVVDATSEVIATRSPLGKGVSFTVNPTGVTFDASGRPSSGSTAIKFSLSSGDNSQRCISLDPSGRPKSVKSACTA